MKVIQKCPKSPSSPKSPHLTVRSMLNYFYWVVTLLKRMIAQFKPYNTTRSRFKSPNQTPKRFFIEFFTEFLVSMLFVIIAILSRNSSVNVNFMEDS